MVDIFISYSRQDLSRVRLLADALSAHGWSVWWDRQIPAGRTFDQFIADALASARAVVVVWSKDSIASSWVREEAEEGRRRELASTEVEITTGQVTSQTLNLRAGFLNLSSVLAAGGPPLVADRYDVFEAKPDLLDGQRKRVSSSAGHEGPSRFAVPAGRYYVTAAYGDALASTEVEVAAGEVKFETLNLRAGILNVSSALGAAGPALTSGVNYDVLEAAPRIDGSRKRVSSSPAHEGPSRFAVPAGRYYVTAASAAARGAAEVVVTAGKVHPIRLSLSPR